jgi:rubrerythrin
MIAAHIKPPGEILERSCSMDPSNSLWICTECGYTAPQRFAADICPRCNRTYWMCSACGFTTVAAFPADICPECEAPCHFKNLTCYVPEMRAADNHDLEWYQS